MISPKGRLLKNLQNMLPFTIPLEHHNTPVTEVAGTKLEKQLVNGAYEFHTAMQWQREYQGLLINSMLLLLEQTEIATQRAPKSTLSNSTNGASLVAQLVKNLPAMQETLV